MLNLNKNQGWKWTTCSPWASLGESGGLWKGEKQAFWQTGITPVKAAIVFLTVNAYKIRNLLNAVRVNNTVIWL